MMKKVLTSIALLACLSGAAAAQSQTQKHEDKHGQHGHVQEQGKTPAEAAPVALAEGEVARRGQPLGASPFVKFADVLREPARYAGKAVVVEGVVERVCQKQGCWMELAPERGARGVRVAMKEHAFFVPFNAAGLRARAEGTFSLKTLSKEDADHFEKEGAKIKRNPDGTADELSFTATGVELRK
jgi:Domain of unknown function (DUF4920)